MTILLLIALPAAAQGERSTGYGASMAVEVSKDIGRFFSVSAEEELRLISRPNGFERNVTSFGLDYAVFDRRLKFGLYYAFIYLYNNDQLYEPRHRSYFNISYKETCEPFTFSWRGRVQGTTRDECRGRYKTNPKYGMKNRLQVEYTLWGSPWKPFVSCDLSNDLNNPAGNALTRFRYQGGVTWRLNRTDYLEFFGRYDQYTDAREENVLSLGVKCTVKLL